MDNLELINVFQNAIIDIYKRENLQCLRGVVNEGFIKDKELTPWFFDVVNKFHSTRDCIKMLEELRSCSDEIMYFTAQLYLYKPFINNPLSEEISLGNDKYLFPNNQNLSAKKYFMYVNVVFEKLYNFWDRIGDLIASFFPELINPKKVFFATAIDIIPKEYHSIEAFVWLKTFKENEYNELNNKRIQVVHYISPNTEDTANHLFILTDRNETEKWITQRYERTEYFKNQINCTIEGMYNTLTLLEKIENKIKVLTTP